MKCEGACLDPVHTLNVAPAAALSHLVPLCPEHWARIEQGVAWFAQERAGEPGRRGVDVVLGDELVGRRIAVAEEHDVTWRRGGFSPQLDPRRNFGVLAVEGRVHGSDERVRLDLALTPGVVAQLRALVRLYPETEDPR